MAATVLRKKMETYLKKVTNKTFIAIKEKTRYLNVMNKITTANISHSNYVKNLIIAPLSELPFNAVK